ncbi:MAG: FAD-binding oxidoreductase [Chloroflexi bacterium]|nr:MAG: FAD-binding oxidoreductase [Chloroflexota bacterium]
MPPSAHPLADYRAEVLWRTQMPELPSFRDRELPDETDVVVVGGGYTGLSAARALARGGARVSVLEANELGYGASTRNGGIVHPGFKWSHAELLHRYGAGLGGELYRESLDGYRYLVGLIREEGIDAELVERGHLELAYAPGHLGELEETQRSLAAAGIAASIVPRARLREEIGSDAYFGALAYEESGGLHPAKYFAGLANAAVRAGADLHEGVRARSVRREPGGRMVMVTDRGSIRARDVVVGTNGYTDGLVPALRRRLIPIGSYIIATEPLSEGLVHELSPKGRVFFDTKNFLYYWRLTADRRMVFGGRASFIPTSVDQTARILHRGLAEVHPQLRDARIEFAWGGRLGFTFDRMPHVGRTGGVTYAMGCCGTGVALMTHLGAKIAGWLGGGDPPVLARLRFPLVPAPYEGRAWFLPAVGEWYRLKDRLAARGRA